MLYPRFGLFDISIDILPRGLNVIAVAAPGLTPSPSKYRHGFGHEIGELKRTEVFRRLSALRRIRRHGAQR